MKVPQCSRNVSSEADGAMSGVWDVAWRLEDRNVYSVSWGRRREKRKVEDLGRVYGVLRTPVANKDSQTSA